jgi:hypothetical protein
MSRLAWYWHRLAAMGPSEIAQRIRKKGVQFVDARKQRDWTSVPITSPGQYPALPGLKETPDALRQALKRGAEEILHGKWRAFGHLPIQVSDPPEWHKDYLVGVDLRTELSAFELDHRTLPKGADIKLIWELSRWQQLTRLAMAAYILGDPRAASKCVHWLEHWVQNNPPYRGWNWTSALEAGMRLIQFTWIDALLRASATNVEHDTALEQLRYDILPAHAWFTWRHKSIGSSANNHLLGELAGLILATVRWPALAAWGASLEELHELWEAEVLAQFAQDGGNKEQALHYHLFSFELCWHVRQALRTAGRNMSTEVDQRLAEGMKFFVTVHGRREPWDYGDSDKATALPLHIVDADCAAEWYDWMEGLHNSLTFWVGAAPQPQTSHKLTQNHWRLYEPSGIATLLSENIFLRFDASRLGYLSTAAHGHLDALHLSIWIDDVAMIVDPGTGAYYSDKDLRSWLASRHAHNGPCPAEPEWPKRLGPFLWSEEHPVPVVTIDKSAITGELELPTAILRRSVSTPRGGEVTVRDSVAASEGRFTVLWQFAPETKCEMLDPRSFRISRHGKALGIHAGTDWDVVDLVSTEPTRRAGQLEGTVSSRFRVTKWAPYLKLTGRSSANPCLFTTTFLISPLP